MVRGLMRAILAATAATAAAGGAFADCLPDGQPARAVHFVGGAVIDGITVKDDIVSYTAHAEGRESRVRAARGLYPVQQSTGINAIAMDWGGQSLPPVELLPVGQEVTVEAIVDGNAKDVFRATYLSHGAETVAVGDCTYRAIRLTRSFFRKDVPIVKGDLWLDPVRLIVLRTELDVLNQDGSPLRHQSTQAESLE